MELELELVFTKEMGQNQMVKRLDYRTALLCDGFPSLLSKCVLKTLVQINLIQMLTNYDLYDF